MWPLLPDALTLANLQEFKPLDYSILSDAFKLGLINEQVLIEGLSVSDFFAAAPSTMLKTFSRYVISLRS
jgi:hypothetical protein